MAPAKWKLAKGKTWRGKLEQVNPNHGKRVPIPKHRQKSMGQGMMLIPKPLDVDALMRAVRKGKLITHSQIREKLASSARVDSTCPMVTGIFVNIAAQAAEEDLQAGKKRVTPYWRTIKDDGKLNDKYPGGAKAHARRLRAEGFKIAPAQGKQPPKVIDFEKYLARINRPCSRIDACINP